jgi:hypothetical protein
MGSVRVQCGLDFRARRMQVGAGSDACRLYAMIGAILIRLGRRHIAGLFIFIAVCRGLFRLAPVWATTATLLFFGSLFSANAPQIRER